MLRGPVSSTQGTCDSSSDPELKQGVVGSFTAVPACDLPEVEEPHGLCPFSTRPEWGTHSELAKQRQVASPPQAGAHAGLSRASAPKGSPPGHLMAGLRAGRVEPSRLLLPRVRSGRSRDVDGRVRTCVAQLSGQDGAAAPGPQDGLPRGTCGGRGGLSRPRLDRTW